VVLILIYLKPKSKINVNNILIQENSMIKNITLTLLTMLVLYGCASNAKKTEIGVTSVISTDVLSLSEDFEKQAGDRVFFGYNESILSAEAKNTLEKQVAWLASHSKVTNVMVEGHCDERGTIDYNVALGARRAEAAKKYLQNKGVAESNLETVSYGKEKPAVDGHDESAWKQNRRAVTIVK
jgi:peptidoglycan-associated lipoprotein